MKVIKIGAVWCSGCLVMRSRWQELEKENFWLKTEYLDYDAQEKQIKKFKVESSRLPVFIFLDRTGKELFRINGEIDKNRLDELIKKYKNK